MAWKSLMLCSQAPQTRRFRPNYRGGQWGSRSSATALSDGAPLLNKIQRAGFFKQLSTPRFSINFHIMVRSVPKLLDPDYS